MRKIHFLLFAIFIVLASCHKDDDDQPTDPVEQLPPATQTGAGTFWFNLKHPTTGKTIKITEGRFDSHFTQ